MLEEYSYWTWTSRWGTCPSIDPPFKKDFDENGFMKSETTEKTRKKRDKQKEEDDRRVHFIARDK